MFWLSYECFSILRNAFLLKSAISSHNSCDVLISVNELFLTRTAGENKSSEHAEHVQRKMQTDPQKFSVTGTIIA